MSCVLSPEVLPVLWVEEVMVEEQRAGSGGGGVEKYFLGPALGSRWPWVNKRNLAREGSEMEARVKGEEDDDDNRISPDHDQFPNAHGISAIEVGFGGEREVAVHNRWRERQLTHTSF